MLINTVSRSLRRYAPRPEASVRVVCFPHAGASAPVYRPWAMRIDPRIDVVAVQLPGRGDRMRERPLETIDEMVHAILPEIVGLNDLPLALFGHSMGAAVAFELALSMAEAGTSPPSRLIVSARRPPDMRDERPSIGQLPDQEFLRELERRYGSIPQEIRSDPEVLAMFLPILRADIGALERYQECTRLGRVTCPLHAWGGSDDPTTPVEYLEAWVRRTHSMYSRRVFAGGHFYLEPNLAVVLREMERLLLPHEPELIQTRPEASA